MFPTRGREGDEEVEPLSVLVALVTYNSASVVRPLLEVLPSAMAGIPRWQLVVADNDSTDDTLDLVARVRPEATIVRMGRNAGYSAGINAAVAAGLPAGAILVTNADVRPEPGTVSRLAEVLEQDPTVGIVVPRLRDDSGRLITSLRREPSLLRMLGEAVLGARRAARAPWASEVVVDPGEYDGPRFADWASGTFMLISGACWAACGRWDESFFLYSEETDYALRAADHGYRLAYEPGATVVHLEGESRVSSRLYGILTVNRSRLFRRRHGRLVSAVFFALLVLKETLRISSPTHRAALRALLRPATRDPHLLAAIAGAAPVRITG